MNVSSAEYGGGKVFGGAGASHTLYTNMGGPDRANVMPSTNGACGGIREVEMRGDRLRIWTK